MPQDAILLPLLKEYVRQLRRDGDLWHVDAVVIQMTCRLYTVCLAEIKNREMRMSWMNQSSKRTLLSPVCLSTYSMPILVTCADTAGLGEASSGNGRDEACPCYEGMFMPFSSR